MLKVLLERVQIEMRNMFLETGRKKILVVIVTEDLAELCSEAMQKANL